ncbi:hypothetical protein HDU67_007377 [Dinochytrium kinnereticum]|nr:hypothetical protein HDU67_007377 [Dinochytrium kinnereticum]
MTYFPGNKHFQRNVELTVLVHHFYGKKWYYLMHIVLYGSLQSFNIASVISAVQNFDTFLLSTFGRTCGFGFSPISGFFCVTETSGQSSPFGSNFMLITAGGLVFAAIMIPMLNLNLDDNMIFQWGNPSGVSELELTLPPAIKVSLIYMLFVVFCWSCLALVHGVKSSNLPSLGPTLSEAPTAVIGQVLFNFTIANTISFDLIITYFTRLITHLSRIQHSRVSIQKTVWTSVYLACGIYCVTGIFGKVFFTIAANNPLSYKIIQNNKPLGALAFDLPEGSDLLSALSLMFTNGPAGSLVKVISLTYPILILLTSIPVSFIVVKLNLVTSRLCSKDWANFWSTIFPMLICIPFQTGPFIATFTSWSSLIFQSLCNFVAPFLIFIFLDKRNLVMQQSVLDELENLDIDGAIKKRANRDDDFDYIYHLPHADLSRLGARRYDPFAKLIEKTTSGGGVAAGPMVPKAQPQITVPTVVGLDGSKTSLQSRRAAAKILEVGINSPDQGLSAHKKVGGGYLGTGGGSHMNLAGSSLGIPGGGGGPNRSRRGSYMGGGSSFQLSGSSANLAMESGQQSLGGSAMIHVAGQQDRRVSMGSFVSKKIHPSDAPSVDYADSGNPFADKSTLNRNSLAAGGSIGPNGEIIVDDDDEDDGKPGFKALPPAVAKVIRPRTAAILCFVITFGLALTVLVYDLSMLGMGKGN